MAKVKIGFITNNRLVEDEDKRFFRLAQKAGVELVVFNAAKEINLEEMKEKTQSCDIILNDEADYISREVAKTLELLGKKIIEPTKIYYYTEDKWLFYLKCLQHKIPVPETILLSTDLVSVKQELQKFNRFPAVIKRVEGFGGEYVDRAEDADKAIAIIRRFWEKGEDRFPVLAQEFIDSDSYRVTMIGGEVVQTAVKKNTQWKATGTSAIRFWKFKIDEELQAIIDKVAKITGIAICGLDLAKKDGHWVVIEANAEPSFKFFDCEYDLMIEKVLDYLKKLATEK
jgi:RimK family alpha-L-glutamate ligase